MDTLRENKPSLAGSNRDGDAAVKANGNGHHHDTEARSWEAVAGNGAHDVLPARTESVTDPDRFARDFTDPLFPTKPVHYAASKRLFDVAVSSAAVMLLSPFMAAAALAVKLTSPGPIIFKQVRVGRGGRHFHCYKFRSMCADAEAQKQKLMHMNEATGPVFKIKRDPRITPVGAFIRKYSIDELPQFFNIIKGDMSLVGPRPPIPSEVARYGAYERGRLAVLPGLTCLWQIGGRSNLSFARWVELDLQYIETMSFTKDLNILVKTVPAVLKGSGAH
jgi:exopolysaccharide biosynthesis polyprenyl glycosylphosphotransferase